MQTIMEALREQDPVIAGKAIVECLDYSKGLDGLPKSNVLKFVLERNCSVIIRPFVSAKYQGVPNTFAPTPITDVRVVSILL